MNEENKQKSEAKRMYVFYKPDDFYFSATATVSLSVPAAGAVVVVVAASVPRVLPLLSGGGTCLPISPAPYLMAGRWID